MDNTLEQLMTAEQRTAHAANEMIPDLDMFVAKFLVSFPTAATEYLEITQELRNCIAKWNTATQNFLSFPRSTND